MKPTAFEALKTNGGFLGGAAKRHHNFSLGAPTAAPKKPKKGKGPKPSITPGDEGFATGDDMRGDTDMEPDMTDPYEATGGMNIDMPKPGKPALTINIHHPAAPHHVSAMKKMQKPRFGGF